MTTPPAVPHEAELVVAPDGYVVAADDAAVRLLGECRGRPLASLVTTGEDVLAELMAAFRRSTSPVPGRLLLRTATGAQSMSLTGRRRSAEVRDVVLTLRLVGDRLSELTTALQRTNTEIARRIAVEEQLRRVWGQTVAQLERSNADLLVLGETFAHDLRNPITTIAGYVGLVLADPDLAPGSRRQLERVLHAAHSMEDIVEGLLHQAVQRSEATRADVALDDLVSWVAPLVDEGVVRLRVEPPLPVVHVAVQSVRQLLLNLVSNAGKHRGRAAPVNVTVTAEQRGERCEVRVADDGPGIPAHLREAVFERGVSTEDEGEHGLGLAMCRKVVREHGGEIEVGEAETGGAVFCFSLPAAAGG